MTRDQLDAAILDYLELHVSPNDYGILGPTLIVLRGARGRPHAVLVPVATGHRPPRNERRTHDKLRAAGVRVVIVRSVAEAQMAAQGLRAPEPLRMARLPGTIASSCRGKWAIQALGQVRPAAWRPNFPRVAEYTSTSWLQRLRQLGYIEHYGGDAHRYGWRPTAAGLNWINKARVPE